MTQIIAGVLLKQNGEYVVQKRDNKPNIAEPGMLSLWGGAADEGETPACAAVRELLEETGINISEDELTFISNFETYGRSPAFIGKTIDVHIFALEVGATTEVKCFEGQGIVRFLHLDDAIKTGDTPTDILIKAIHDYEEKTRQSTV